MKVTLSPDQQVAVDKIVEWYKGDNRTIFTMVGYAGTGKSTIIGNLKEVLGDITIAYATFTGKASYVLKKKLGFDEGTSDYCGTIHGLIYKPEIDEKTNEIVMKDGSPVFVLKSDFEITYDLIIIDESSMVGEILTKDLMSFGIPILFVGDNGQLPPVKDNPFLHTEKPDAVLDKIHRQAEGNPIIRFSKDIREGKVNCDYGNNVFICDKHRQRDMIDRLLEQYDINNTQVLVATNRTRIELNKNLKASCFKRGLIDKERELGVGDKIICLKNNRKKGIFNGMIGIVEQVTQFDLFYNLKINFDGLIIHCNAYAKQFNSEKTLSDELYQSRLHFELFDYAYAVTTHKAQGSEFKDVIIFRQQLSLWDQKKWDYTAVTRAVENVVMVMD